MNNSILSDLVVTAQLVMSLCSRPMFMTRGAAFLLLVIHLLLCVRACTASIRVLSSKPAPMLPPLSWPSGVMESSRGSVW